MCNLNSATPRKATRSLRIISPLVSGEGTVRINDRGVSTTYDVSVAPFVAGDVVDMVWKSGKGLQVFTSLDGRYGSQCDCPFDLCFNGESGCCVHIAAGLRMLELGLIQPTIDDVVLDNAEQVQAWELQEAY